MVLDEKLKFNSHIQHVCTKISKSIGILNKLRYDLPLSTMKTLYFSFVYPLIFYCISVWGGTFKIHLKPLIILQKKAIRIINNVEYLAHTNELFMKNSILKLEDIHTLQIGVFMFKNSNLPRFSVTHHHYTRQRTHSVSNFQRLTITQHSIYFIGPKLWNEIPLSIRNSNSLNIFKGKFKEILISNYSLNEEEF